MRKDGKFVGVDGTIPEGQGIVMAHLNECHELVEMVRFVFPRQSAGTCFEPPSPPSLHQLKQSMDDVEDDEDLTEDDDGQGPESGATSERDD